MVMPSTKVTAHPIAVESPVDPEVLEKPERRHFTALV